MFAYPAKAKHAAKVGLAMVLAYGLALQWGWDNPYWAGMAVTFCSLTSTGESLNKSVLRIWGTLLGTSVAFLILGLFLQDRWLFLLAICIHLAFVTYMMTGTKAKYMWQVAGFVSVIIMSGATGDSNDIFQYGMARMQETLLGCSVWALVTIIIWPVTNKGALEKTAVQLLSVQRRLIDECRRRCFHGAIASDQGSQFSALRSEQVALLAKLQGELMASGAESYAVREMAAVWRQFLFDSQALLAAIDNLHAGRLELEAIDVQRVLPDCDAYVSAVIRILDAAGSVLANKPECASMPMPSLELDKSVMAALGHFDRAAIVVTVAHMGEIETLTARLHRLAAELRGQTNTLSVADGQAAVDDDAKSSRKYFVLDPDRLRASVYIIAVTCLGFLSWVYFDPPGHQSLWSMAPTIGFVAAMSPHVHFGRAFLRALFIYLPVAGSCYILIMPSLSGYLQLSVLIFVYVFWAQYKLNGFLAVAAAMLGLLTMMPVTNTQTYSFVGIATGYLFILLCMVVVIVCAYILGSPRPEKMFMRLIRRYFESTGFVLEIIARSRDYSPGFLLRYRMAFHQRETLTLPQKLQLWSAQINLQNYPHNSTEKISALVAGLDGLNYRLQELLELRTLPQAPYLVAELTGQIKEWREVLQQSFALIVRGGSPGSADQLVAQLNQWVTRIEGSLNTALASADGQQLSDAQLEHAYQFLGAYRGLANATVAWLGQAEGIDWEEWHEECFS